MPPRKDRTFSFQVHDAGDRTLDGIFRLIAFGEREEPLEDVLTAMCGDVAAIARADIASIYVREDDLDGIRFTMRGNVGFPREALGRVHLRPGEGITGFAAERLRPVSVAMADRDEHFKYIPGLGEERYPALLAVPVLRAGAAAGVLVLQREPDQGVHRRGGGAGDGDRRRHQPRARARRGAQAQGGRLRRSVGGPPQRDAGGQRDRDGTRRGAADAVGPGAQGAAGAADDDRPARRSSSVCRPSSAVPWCRRAVRRPARSPAWRSSSTTSGSALVSPRPAPRPRRSRRCPRWRAPTRAFPSAARRATRRAPPCSATARPRSKISA